MRRIDLTAVGLRGPSIPAHTILPPCSGPSRYGLEMSQSEARLARRPTLTAPARDRSTCVQAGTKRCSRPNQKMDPASNRRRTTCPQTPYPDPKHSPLHETGASPLARKVHELLAKKRG